jgi:hypothetical protein
MLELLALPLVLLTLSFLTLDLDSKLCMRVLAYIYAYDGIIGSWLYTDATYYLSVLFLISLQAACFTILMSKRKRLVGYSLLLLIFILNLNEHLNEYQTVFYPYLNYINYWSGELLSIIITWNVKWKIYEYKNISN